MFRILAIVGGREFNDFELLEMKFLETIQKYPRISEIITGCAKGTDSMAIRIAEKYNLPYRKFTADWFKYKNSA